MVSFTGTITTASTGQWGMTWNQMIYSQNPDSTTKFESMWSGSHQMTVWISGTSSNSYSYSNNQGGTTSSSAASNLIVTSLFGYRIFTQTIGSTLTPGLYMFGMKMSTSSANVSAIVRSHGVVFDAPASVLKGYFNEAAVSSRGFQDGGVYSVTSGAMPASVGLSEIRQMNDLCVWFKLGAI